MKKKKKSVPRWLQIVSTIVANAAIVLSVVYILFYILDGFNPMLHFLGVFHLGKRIRKDFLLHIGLKLRVRVSEQHQRRRLLLGNSLNM